MRPTTLRLGALLAAGALATHELRYRVSFGGAAPSKLDATGHGYLSVLTALVAVALAFGLAQFVLQMAHPTRADREALRGPRLWLLASAALLTLYTGQELLEGWLAPGHPTGVGGAFGDGGWVAIGLAIAIGAVISACMHGAEVVLARRLARLRVQRSGKRSSPASPLERPILWCDRPVARYLVGRAPPLVLSH